MRVAATALQRFWSTVAHRHAQVWNAAELGRALDHARMGPSWEGFVIEQLLAT